MNTADLASTLLDLATALTDAAERIAPHLVADEAPHVGTCPTSAAVLAAVEPQPTPVTPIGLQQSMRAVLALAELDAHDTPLLISHHLGDEWVRWNDVRDLIRTTADSGAGAPASTDGAEATRTASAAPAPVIPEGTS